MNTVNGITTDKSEFVKESRNLTTHATLTTHPNYKEIVWQMIVDGKVIASGCTDKSQTEYVLGCITGNSPCTTPIAEIIYNMFI